MIKLFKYKRLPNRVAGISTANDCKAILLPVVFCCFIISCNGQAHTQSQAADAIKIDTLQKTRPGFYSVRGHFDTAYGNVHGGFQDRAGNLWFGTTGAGTLRYDGKIFTHFMLHDELNNNTLAPLLEDKQGNIWFSAAEGIYRYNGKIFTSVPLIISHNSKEQAYVYPATPKPKPISIISALQDKKGNIWLGTETSGVYRFDGRQFTHILELDGIDNSSGLKLNTITSMLEDRNGNIWFASWNKEGLCCYNGKTIVSYTRKNGLGDDMIYSLWEDGTGNIWIGTRDHGVWRYDGKSFTDITASTDLKDETIYAIKQDQNGDFWLATQSKGLWRYDGKSFKNFTTRDGLSHTSVFCIVAAKNGNLWLGTRGMGLSFYDGRKITDLTTH